MVVVSQLKVCADGELTRRRGSSGVSQGLWVQLVLLLLVHTGGR